MKLAVLLTLASVGCASPDGVSVPLPGGAPGIGFDDLQYSARLHAVLAPAGRSGNLALVDPDTLAVRTVSGFSASGDYGGGHDFGATSVDEGRGVLFVTDRTTQKLYVVDPNAGIILGSTPLGGSPDYVRYVAPTDEVWVSEPSAGRIEILSFASASGPVPSSAGSIPVSNGPESLVVDPSAGRAYTHRWQASTLVFDVSSRAVVGEWPNGCAASRGLAVDHAHGTFFAGCMEGTASVLDTAHGGAIVSSLARGAGFDVLGFNPSLGHLYLAGTVCECLIVLGVSRTGSLSFLGRFGATSSSHCAVADDRGHAWVCDPDGGRLLRIDDPFPASW